MITKLSLRNFKAANAEYTFDRGNLIQGDNFTGKSAIDQAIRCLVLGYVPGVAKNAAGIKMFASDYPMEIAADVAGKHFTAHPRIAFEKVKSSIKQTADAILGEIMDEPTRVLFDPTIFFGLSDSARISKACELVQSAGMTREDISATVARVLGIDITPGKTITTREPQWPRYERWTKEVYAKSLTVPDLLTASEEFWKGERKTVAAEKDRMQSTVEGVADLGAAEAKTDQLPTREEVVELKTRAEAELRKIRDRLAGADALAKEIAADNKRAAELAPAVANLDALREEVARLQTALDAVQERQGPADVAAVNASLAHQEAKKIADQVEADRKSIASLQEQVAQIASLEKTLTDLETSIASQRSTLTSHRVTASAFALKHHEAKAAAEVSKAPRTSGELRTDDFDTNATPGVRYLVTATATIGEGGVPEILSVEDWKELIENADELEEAARAEEYEATQRIAELSEELDSANEAVEAAEAEIANLSVQLEETREALTRAKMAKEQLDKIPDTHPIQDADKLRGLAHSAELAATLVRQLRVEVKQIGDLLSQKRAAVTRAESAQEELAALKAKSVSRSDILDDSAIAELRSDEATQAHVVAGCDVTLQKITAAEADQKRIESAATRRAEVEAEYKLLGKVIDVIKQKKTELVSVSIEAPLAVANKLAAGILKGPLVFEEGEIGMRVGDSFVSARVFSGTETAIVMMGLTAGLAATAPLRVLILDEVARLTTRNAVTLLTNLRSMVADGNIDQFFLIGPSNDLLADVCRQNEVNVIAL